MHPGKQYLSALFLLFSLSNFSIGQESPWQNIGPYMGFINSMAMDDAHPDTVYAATPYGVYKTVDAAENWIKTSLAGLEADQVVVSQKSSSHILCRTEYQVYQSVDFGEHWDMIWSDTIRIKCIDYNPENASTIVIGTDNGFTPAGWDYSAETPWFHRSNNGGASWHKVYFNGPGISEKPNSAKYILIDPSDTLKIYVGTQNRDGGGMYISHNNGDEWMNINLFDTNENVYALACTPAGYEDHTLCVISYDSDIFDRTLLISKDFGMTWEEKHPPSSFELLGNVNKGSTLYISKDFPKYIHIGAAYEYEDGSSSIVAYNLEGDTWHYYPDTPLSFPTSILTCNLIDYLGFSDKGVYRYDLDEDLWFSKNRGFSSVEVLDLASYPESPDKMLVLLDDNLFKTDNLGQSWYLLDDTYFDRNTLFIKHNDTTSLIAGTNTHSYIPPGSHYYIYKSQDGGLSWNGQDLFTNWSSYDAKWRATEITGPQNSPETIFIGMDGSGLSYDGFYKSVNGGESWSHKTHTGVSAIAIDPTANDIVYHGTSNLGYVLRSENAGNTWIPISPGGQSSFVGAVWGLGVDNLQQVFAATSAGLFKWEEGTIWSLVESFPSIQTTCLVIDNEPEVPIYYVGTTDQGVFLSEDGGTTWSGYNTGLQSSKIASLKINNSPPGRLYAGTKDGGVWITGLVEEKEAPVSLLQKPQIELAIYPNPNTGSFNISAGSESDLKGSIQIINLLGEVLYTEPHFEVPAGQSRHILVDQMAPGCYILIFKNKQQISTKKILVEKR